MSTVARIQRRRDEKRMGMSVREFSRMLWDTDLAIMASREAPFDSFRPSPIRNRMSVKFVDGTPQRMRVIF